MGIRRIFRVGGFVVVMGVLLASRVNMRPVAAEPKQEPSAKPRTLDLAPVRPFLEQHCVDCHGPDRAKGGLRLDNLPADLTNADRFHTWEKVLARVASGEMPPKKRTQPAEADSKAFVKSLQDQLHRADRAALPLKGSLSLRRMNRVQYENTVRDLLSLDIDLKDRLPPDTRAHGFDNVGSALSLSSAQLEAYLSAADAALDAAIVTRARPVGIKTRIEGREALTQYSIRREGRLLELEEAAVGFGRLEFYAHHNGIPEEGRYRVRASVYTYKSPDKPVELYVRTRHTTGDEVVGYFEAPLNEPGVLEFVCKAKKNSYIVFQTYKLPYLGRLPDPAERKGPGIGLQWVEIEGPLYESWPPPSHRRLFGDLPLEPTAPKSKLYTVKSRDASADARRLLADFMRRAYRRPITENDLEPVLALVTRHLAEKNNFEESMRVGYKAVLCSPHFLFFPEKVGEPDDFALAARLSYFLWNTTPDGELDRLAERGELHKPETLRVQVERMLTSPKSAAFVRNFLDQWLDLRLIDSTAPDPKLYPEYDTALQTAIIQEVELVFRDMLKQDLPVTHTVDANFTYLNERLARHYGIAGVDGPQMRKVDLPPGCHRGGLMTSAAVLKVTANGSYTHPVHRGVWVLRNILGKPPEPPPPNAGAVEPDLRGLKTIREQLDVHRKAEACASCHIKIDPPGFALENFDVTGGWRDQYRILSGPKLLLSKKGPAVESNHQLPDGRPFQDIDGLKKLLLEDKDQLARCVAEKLLIYSTGRVVRYSDKAVVDEIVARNRARGYGLRSLIHEVIQSRLFVTPES